MNQRRVFVARSENGLVVLNQLFQYPDEDGRPVEQFEVLVGGVSLVYESEGMALGCFQTLKGIVKSQHVIQLGEGVEA